MFFLFMHKQEVNLCAWNMRCTMQAFSNWCYHFFVFQIVKWIFVILNQIPIHKNNIKGTTFLTYIQLDNMKFTQFWDKLEYLFILLVGGAINSLKPNKASKFTHWDRYPNPYDIWGLYRDNRGDTSLVPILYWSQY